jgi:hypothetical protein
MIGIDPNHQHHERPSPMTELIRSICREHHFTERFSLTHVTEHSTLFWTGRTITSPQYADDWIRDVDQEHPTSSATTKRRRPTDNLSLGSAWLPLRSIVFRFVIRSLKLKFFPQNYKNCA